MSETKVTSWTLLIIVVLKVQSPSAPFRIHHHLVGYSPIYCTVSNMLVHLFWNCPKLDQIHEKTLINDCPENVCDVSHFIKNDLSNTSNFADVE